MVSSTRPATTASRTGRAPSRTSSTTTSPGSMPSTSPRIREIEDPVGRQSGDVSGQLHDPAEVRAGGHPHDREVAVPVAVAQSHRHRAERLHRHHPGQGLDLVEGPGGDRLHEGDGDVLALHQVELQVGEHVHGVEEDETEEQDPYREGDPDHRGRRPPGVALDVAQDHPGGVSQTALELWPLHEAGAVLRRWLGAHGLRRWHPHRPAHRQERPQAAGGQGDERGRHRHVAGEAVEQDREAEELVVERDHARAHPAPPMIPIPAPRVAMTRDHFT